MFLISMEINMPLGIKQEFLNNLTDKSERDWARKSTR
jgi:hypothetical protein